ncbi:MAG: glycoside hydrolase family 20 zincin-like fold domain-containing protein [Armatimonadota bacterium]|nr:glycoside hydrolase family 20 zincin-like fold domain-containing protein [Armatimonadota bacterium]
MRRVAPIVAALALVGSSLAPRAQRPVRIADELDILPTPREIVLTGDRLPLAGWSISAAEGVTLAQTGADEVNERIAALGADALQVRSELGAGNTIIVAPCTHALARDLASELHVSPDDPGEQGYVIAPVPRDGRMIIAAIGSDGLGTLYACMTLRQMIQPGEAGPELAGARVRDWPMFKRRCFGCIEILDDSPEGIEDDEERLAAYAEEYEPHIRFLARNKINFVNSRGYWGGLEDPQLEAYGAASEFAARYGIRVHRVHGTASPCGTLSRSPLAPSRRRDTGRWRCGSRSVSWR